MKQHTDHKEYEAGDEIILEKTYGDPTTETIHSATKPKWNDTLGAYEQTLSFGPGTQPITI